MVPVAISGASECHVAGASGIFVTETRKLSLKLATMFGGSLASTVSVSATGLYKGDTLEGVANRGDFKLGTE